MKRNGNTGYGPDHLEPTDAPEEYASLATHPEQLASKDFIEVYLRKGNMLLVDGVPSAAIIR
jgi:hypothetical protein